MNTGFDGKLDGSLDIRDDGDAGQVIEILRGASRAKRDPDVELVILAARLRGAKDDVIRSALAALMSDEDPD